MQSRFRFLAIILCLSLLLILFGCSNKPGDNSVPADNPIPVEEIKPLYAAACQAIHTAPDLSLAISTKETRLVGGEAYIRQSNGTALYTDIGTANMEALISENLALGTYEAKYVQSYIDGAAYCQTSGCSFTAELSAAEFMEAQIPAVLLDIALYPTLRSESSGDNYLITFADATALESWAVDSQHARLISASGTVTLDKNGVMLGTAYHAEYTLSAAVYTLDVQVAITAPGPSDIRSQQPKYPANCTTLSCFTAPRMLLQVVGDVYSSAAMTGLTSETIYCAAAAATRTQTIQVDTFGRNNAFMAKTDYVVNLTDYANNTVSNTKTETFRNGVFSYTANGSGPITQSGITAKDMRSYCEDAVLAALFTPNYLAGAELTDTGDFYHLTFQGTEAFAENLFDKIYSILTFDLDAYASGYTTEYVTGYLTINKYTGLPTAMGISTSRTHTIDKVPYVTTYQLDQSLNLSSKTAYKTITGQALPETAPAKTATPLFYKVTGANDQTLWLLGTIHIGDERTGFLPAQITNAFANSDALALEFNTDAFNEQAAQDPTFLQQLTDAYYYTDGSKTSVHLDAALYEKAYPLLLASGNNTASIPYMKIAIWNNLITNFQLQQDYGLTAEQGLERRLQDMAQKQNKPILEIESGLSQIQMLTGYSEPLQILLLQETVSTSLIESNQDLRELYELWCAGNETDLTNAVVEDTADMTEEELALYQEYYKATITDRNARMLDVAKEYLESGDTVFYAVGLAHLLGEDGLVKSLRDAGYTVEIVTYA